MGRKFQIAIVAILPGLIPLIALSDAQQTVSESYYERVKSLLSPLSYPDPGIDRNATDRDVNLIEIEEGAAGVVFGASMDDVVALWGKPQSISFVGVHEMWDLWIGGCRFGFVDNRLTSIDVVSFALKKAHLANGIDFQSSYGEVKSAFGEPIEATDSRLKFATENDYTIKFYFVSDELTAEKGKLLSIEISHPDSDKYMRQRLNRTRMPRMPWWWPWWDAAGKWPVWELSSRP